MGTAPLDDLAIFAAIAESAGITPAAKRLRLPKSSVSRALSRLEASLGVKLVHRTTRRFSLSTAGTALHERVAPLLESLEQSLQALPERDALPSGRLRLTMPVDFGATLGAELVTRFMARYPEVDVHAHLSNALVDIVGEGFDLAIRFAQQRLKDSSLIAVPVSSLSFQVFASARYLARHEPPRAPSELGSHAWVARRGEPVLMLSNGSASARVKPRARLICDDMFFLRASLVASAGIGLLPAYVAEADVKRGTLMRVLPRWTVPSGRMWIVHASAPKLPAKVAAFRDFLVETLRAHPLA